jgi:hypothetical protein
VLSTHPPVPTLEDSMIKLLSAAALAAAVIGLVPPAAAQAAASAPARPLPNPCKTFKLSAAATLLGAGRHTRLTEKLTSARHPFPIRTCTIRHAGKQLEIVVARQQGGTGSEESCFTRRKLGRQGIVCVSIPKSPPFSFAQFRKDGIWVTDGINVMLRDKGQRIYDFALPQYKAFKG